MIGGPHFHFLSLFPETIESWFQASILGRAQAAGRFSTKYYQLRDFADDKHRTVDDVAYGGGGGMVLKADVLARATEHIRRIAAPSNLRTIYFSPVGERLNTQLLRRHAERIIRHGATHTLLICGHYEGVDQRFIEAFVDEEISLGDFVLTGGELAAAAFTDALVRHLDGVVGDAGHHDNESFHLAHPESSARLLEYPHYTRPSEFMGRKVPDILLSGNHQKISEWRLQQAVDRTKLLRPDLLRPSTPDTN